MEKQVKVNVSWQKNGVKVSTDKGVVYYFEFPGILAGRGSYESIFSSLVSAFILPTFKAAFDASIGDEFSFEFKVMDKKES